MFYNAEVEVVRILAIIEWEDIQLNSYDEQVK